MLTGGVLSDICTINVVWIYYNNISKHIKSFWKLKELVAQQIYIGTCLNWLLLRTFLNLFGTFELSFLFNNFKIEIIKLSLEVHAAEILQLHTISCNLWISQLESIISSAWGRISWREMNIDSVWPLVCWGEKSIKIRGSRIFKNRPRGDSNPWSPVY